MVSIVVLSKQSHHKMGPYCIISSCRSNVLTTTNYNVNLSRMKITLIGFLDLLNELVLAHLCGVNGFRNSGCSFSLHCALMFRPVSTFHTNTTIKLHTFPESVSALNKSISQMFQAFTTPFPLFFNFCSMI